MQNSRYALLGFAAVVIAGGVAAYYGMAPQKAGVPVQDNAQTNTQIKQDETVKTEQSAPVTKTENTPTAPTTVKPVEPVNATSAETVTVPVFDVLRLESDGSLVIAGKAAPNAMVDVISKSRVLGSAKAGENGDFAIILDQALKAGDYQLVLRATGEDKSVATSQQTAILSVPETPDGQVLALVEEPGQASRMITTPEAETAVTAQPAQTAPTGQASAIIGAVPAPDTGAAIGATKSDDKINIAVEAVEIEGQSVFIAGHARGGQSVNVSANEKLLGTAVVTPEGRYLVQTHQPLAVGDYIIRADLMNAAGKVLATARVPFRREAGENIAAVAPKILHVPAQDTQPVQQATSGETGQPLEKAEGSVIIRKGDNLWTISKRTYGSGMRYTTIYLANSDQIKNPNLIWPGQVFVMPTSPLSDEAVKQKQP